MCLGKRSGPHALVGLRHFKYEISLIRVNCERSEEVLNGLGIAIISTSKGLLKDQDARRQKLGGELVCTVW